MILTFYNGDSIQVDNIKGERINQAIDAGAEWIVLGENRYKVSNIAGISSSSIKQYKSYSELGLPNIALPDEIEAAYEKRTKAIQFRENKLIG